MRNSATKPAGRQLWAGLVGLGQAGWLVLMTVCAEGGFKRRERASNSSHNGMLVFGNSSWQSWAMWGIG